jgi:hypothetical protein
MDFYERLFGEPTKKLFSLVRSEIDDIPHISQEENNILTPNFVEKGVYDAIMQIERNKAPEIDGF